MPIIYDVFPLATGAFDREKPYCSYDIVDRVVRVAAVVFLAAVDILTLPFRAGFWVGKAICCPQQNEESSLSSEPLSLEDIRNQINEAQNLEQLIPGIQAFFYFLPLDSEEEFLELVNCIANKEKELNRGVSEEESKAFLKAEIDALRDRLSGELLTVYFQCIMWRLLKTEGLSIDQIESEMGVYRRLYPDEDLTYSNILESAFDGVLKEVAEESVSIEVLNGKERVIFIDTSLWLGDGAQLIEGNKVMPQTWYGPLLNRIKDLMRSEGRSISSVLIKTPGAIKDSQIFRRYVLSFGAEVLRLNLNPLLTSPN